jgi:hypothetical protein
MYVFILFEGRSPIILRGRREKGMYYFFSNTLYMYFLKVFLKLFVWSYLSQIYNIIIITNKFIQQNHYGSRPLKRTPLLKK